MEIRCVVNEVKNEYPKIKQVSKKKLANSIPIRWLKVGLSSLGIAMIMKNKALALSSRDINTIDIAGVVPARIPISIPIPIRICNVACPIVQRVSAVVFIITGLSILITNMKYKKQPEPKKVKKWIKVVFILSIIVFILSILTKCVINSIDYN